VTHRNHSLRTQLILLVVVSLLVASGALEIIRLYQQQSVLINSERRVGLSLIHSVNTTINSVRSFISTLGDISELDSRLAELVQINSNITFIAVTDGTGLVLFHSSNDYQDTAIPALAGLPSDATVPVDVPGYGEVFLTSLPFDSSDLSGPDEYWIVIASLTEPIRSQLLESAVSSIMLTGLFTVLSALGIIVFAQGYFVRPLENLTQAANAIEAGDLTIRADAKQNNEIGQLARSFNRMTQQLAQSINTLEERVNERVRDLNVASQVSRQLTTKLDRNQLLADVARLTAEAFDLYHVSIFLYDQSVLTLVQGTGEIGQQLVEHGKTFKLNDRGVVPQAARTHSAVLANDVTQDQAFSANPLLPETQSELAIPILYQEKLLGVLDLQAKQVNRYQAQDVSLMTTLAEQIAIAIHNAQLFADLQDAQAASERSDKVKSAFLASMSHELRTPLNAIINFTRYVAKGSLGPVNDEQIQILNEVVDSGKHLLNLINDVLDMSKIEADSLALFVEDDINMKSILNSVVFTGKSLLGEKSVEIQVEIEDEMPLIRGDRQRIMQVLLNIVSNACKFTSEGFIKIRAYQKDDNIICTIQDTGPGISPEDQEAVFQAFKQTSTGLRQGGGTGLGMPISRSLAEAHGGKLWLESKVGQGTQFHFSLPIRSEILLPYLVA
jgi:signal transduction histidine kinase